MTYAGWIAGSFSVSISWSSLFKASNPGKDLASVKKSISSRTFTKQSTWCHWSYRKQIQNRTLKKIHSRQLLNQLQGILKPNSFTYKSICSAIQHCFLRCVVFFRNTHFILWDKFFASNTLAPSWFCVTHIEITSSTCRPYRSSF